MNICTERERESKPSEQQEKTALDTNTKEQSIKEHQATVIMVHQVVNWPCVKTVAFSKHKLVINRNARKSVYLDSADTLVVLSYLDLGNYHMLKFDEY